MATPKGQRIGIWVISIVMMVGTIGSFAVMILASKNDTAEKARIQQLVTQYQSETQTYQAKVDAQTKKLSGKYYKEFNAYASLPVKFDKSKVKSLVKKDLKTGEGDKLTSKSTFAAYYIGWTPDGKVFDSSIDGGKLKAPIKAGPGSVISGWNEGVDGMKTGGTRELTIPSDKAYGKEGSGSKIPANTPLKFVIMVIPTPEAIVQPQPSRELVDYYNRNGVQ